MASSRWQERKKLRKRLWQRRIMYKKISHGSDMGRCFGADIGGTLAKLVFFEQKSNTQFMRRPRSQSHDMAADEMRQFVTDRRNYGQTGIRDLRLKIESKRMGGTLHFICFETRKMDGALALIAHHGLNQSVRHLRCTGGGAFKFESMFNIQAGIKLKICDEMDCTIKGLNFLLNFLPTEVYSFQNVDFASMTATKVRLERQNTPGDIFPYTLVSIGSGVSILVVKSPTEYERVSGSSLGGGTYWGLCRLLTSCTSYDEALDMSENGNNFQVDMSVGDIYGGAYDKFNLSARTVASSFGKIPSLSEDHTRIADADIARSLLIMITQNIGQIAYLNACIHQTKRIFFVGNFLRHNKISCRTLAYAIHFWSKGEMEAQFCLHEGYLGALGAFLYNVDAQQSAY